MKSHIIAQAAINSYLKSFIGHNGPMNIEKHESSKLSNKNPKVWKLITNKDVDLFCKQNFYIELQELEKFEAKWNKKIESPFFAFSHKFKAIVQRDIYEQEPENLSYAFKINNETVESILKNNFDKIIKYFILCLQRELIRIFPNEKDLFIEVTEIFSIKKFKNINNFSWIEDAKKTNWKFYFETVYNDIKENFYIVILDSFSTNDLLLDSPIIISENCVIFLYQIFGTIIFIRNGWNLTNEFKLVRNNNSKPFITNKDINPLISAMEILNMWKLKENSLFSNNLYVISKSPI